MQTRYVEAGNTVTAEGIQLINKSFHSPALLRGGELSTKNQKLVIAPSTIMLPNGIVVYETENREISFLTEGWKTVYYRYIEENILGGTPSELLCIEGIYTQEELVLTSESNNDISTIVAWVYYSTSYGLKFEKPNNPLYPQFDMTINDFVSNKVYAKDLLNYVYLDANESNKDTLVKYLPEYGHVRVNGQESDKGTIFLRNNYPIVFKIPFSVEELGCFVIEREAEIGAELKFTFESLDGVLWDTSPSSVLSGYFESKGTYNVEGSLTSPTVDVFSDFENNTTLKNKQTELQFFKVVVRPKKNFIGNVNTTYDKLPIYGVLNITICPFDSVASTGSDGVQLIRSVGFSKYNVPQVRNF